MGNVYFYGFQLGTGIALGYVFVWVAITLLYLLAISGALGLIYEAIRAFLGFVWAVLKWIVS